MAVPGNVDLVFQFLADSFAIVANSMRRFLLALRFNRRGWGIVFRSDNG